MRFLWVQSVQAFSPSSWDALVRVALLAKNKKYMATYARGEPWVFRDPSLHQRIRCDHYRVKSFVAPANCAPPLIL
jgi:hypothetical protein